MNNVRNLSFVGICMAFVVIALGAWTRLVDAGLGCPDWPGCYGFVFWPNDEAEIALAESRFPTFPYDINKAIPEQVHRIFAASLGLIAIILVALSSNTKSKSIQRWSIFLLVLIRDQIIQTISQQEQTDRLLKPSKNYFPIKLSNLLS